MDPLYDGLQDYNYRPYFIYPPAVEKPPTAERSDASMITDVEETKDI